ncbi:hypothetical protein BD770DRAFT_426211 [Pilaira anomala]|nr:hypothetical protein BD770DRAFT_426211 [Pilaira anomala]
MVNSKEYLERLYSKAEELACKFYSDVFVMLYFYGIRLLVIILNSSWFLIFTVFSFVMFMVCYNIMAADVYGNHMVLLLKGPNYTKPVHNFMHWATTRAYLSELYPKPGCAAQKKVFTLNYVMQIPIAIVNRTVCTQI